MDDFKVDIKIMNSCFDYIDNVSNYNNRFYVTIFIEPVGLVSLNSSSYEKLIEGVNKLFNSQPEDYGYVKAGYVLFYNLSLPVFNGDLDSMDFNSIWESTYYDSLLENNSGYENIQNVKEALSYYNQGEIIYLRLNCCNLDEHLYREGLILKVRKIKYLGKDNYLVICNENDSVNILKELEFKISNNIHDFILNNNNKDFYFFHEENLDDVKNTWNEYKNSHYYSMSDFEDFLISKNVDNI